MFNLENISLIVSQYQYLLNLSTFIISFLYIILVNKTLIFLMKNPFQNLLDFLGFQIEKLCLRLYMQYSMQYVLFVNNTQFWFVGYVAPINRFTSLTVDIEDSAPTSLTAEGGKLTADSTPTSLTASS